MKHLYFKQMQDKLRERFPQAIVKCASEFSEDYKPGQAIWIPNGYQVEYTKKDSNSLTILDTGRYDVRGYDIDVYIKFNKWCNNRGWYASTEEYTLMLYIL